MNEFMNEENKREGSMMDNFRASFTGRKFRSGAYVSLISAIVVVLILVVNLIVSELDLNIDLSSQDLYTLTDDTLELVNNLEDDITIYYLVETGTSAKVFQKIAEKYDNLSERITLEQKDPVLYPKFASQYVEDPIITNSFLVVNHSNNRAKYIDNSEMFVKEFNYQKYDFDITGIDVEGKLTSAIQYVTTPDLPVLYMTSGHSELEMGELFKETMKKQNVTVNTLETIKQETIPEDCDILFINAPRADFTIDEITRIKDYMAAGGNVIAVLDYRGENMPNLLSLLDYYGIEMKDGVVCEGDANMHVPQYPHYIVPKILDHEITATVTDSKRYVITPIAAGLVESENNRSSIKLQPLLTTSDKAYSKVDDNAITFEKEAGDIEGPFYLGVLSSDTYNSTTSNLVVYTSELIFEDSSIGNYGNMDLLKSTVSFLSGEVSPISVRTRSVLPESIYLTQQQAISWGVVTVVVVPVVILVIGIFVSLRRRKR